MTAENDSDGSRSAGPLVEMQLDQQGNTARVVLTRPSMANALSPAMVEELTATLTRAAAERPVVVIGGCGKNFCGGFDLADDEDRLPRFLRLAELLEHLRELPAVTIATAHGNAIGAGADLVTHCDIRIGAPGVRFRFPGFSRFGVVLGTRRLAELVGSAAAIEAATQNTLLDTDTAHRTGLLDHVIPQDGWDEWVATFASSVGHAPRTSIAALLTAARAAPSGRGDSLSHLARSLIARPTDSWCSVRC